MSLGTGYLSVYSGIVAHPIQWEYENVWSLQATGVWDIPINCTPTWTRPISALPPASGRF